MLPSKVLIFQKHLVQDREKTLFEKASDFYKKGRDILFFLFLLCGLRVLFFLHANQMWWLAWAQEKSMGLKYFWNDILHRPKGPFIYYVSTKMGEWVQQMVILAYYLYINHVAGPQSVLKPAYITYELSLKKA